MQSAPLATCSLMDSDASSHTAVFGHQVGVSQRPDDSISDIEEDAEDDGEEIDEEAFYAVFPQAPTLVKHHTLRPVVDALRMLIAKPEKLVATVLCGDTGAGLKPQDLDALEAKARAYTQSQLAAVLSEDDWTRIDGFSQRGATHEERWTSRQLVQDVDALMMKLTVYYVSTWDYIAAVLIGYVYHIESTIAELHAQWVPDNGSLLSVPFRPLRLRSHTMAMASATPPPRLPPVPAPATPSPTATASGGANHRARLARQSNEFMIAWFLHHKANPYPSGAERVQIAKKTGLTEQQVRNWFANMRKRHWKPKHEKKAKQPRCLLDMLLRQNDTATSSSKSKSK